MLNRYICILVYLIYIVVLILKQYIFSSPSSSFNMHTAAVTSYTRTYTYLNSNDDDGLWCILFYLSVYVWMGWVFVCLCASYANCKNIYWLILNFTCIGTRVCRRRWLVPRIHNPFIAQSTGCLSVLSRSILCVLNRTCSDSSSIRVL